MSSSDGAEFESWVKTRYAETDGFTALFLLLSIGGGKIEMISCAFVHVIGDEVAWASMKTMLDASRRRWDGVAIFAESPPGGGPLIDIVAKARLQERIDAVTFDRMVLNEAGLFDPRGRMFRIDPIEALQ
ncbi:MAG: hypothetical protein NW205_05575 [Hyphomicrobiaceae bacterium]|nr:hypothetical protein [Hyphomicrobiaceae bacterium]